MSNIEWTFHQNGQELKASILCLGDGRLESGKRGWYFASEHIPTRLGNWRLQIRFTLVEPKTGYNSGPPLKAGETIIFDPDYAGSLEIEGKLVTLTFRIPDCLNPPNKKSFIWQGPVQFAGGAYHSQVKLVIIDPQDGTFLRRFAATPLSNGGILVKRSSDPASVDMSRLSDSNCRGREGRISAVLHSVDQSSRVSNHFLVLSRRWLKRLRRLSTVTLRSPAEIRFEGRTLGSSSAVFVIRRGR